VKMLAEYLDMAMKFEQMAADEKDAYHRLACCWLWTAISTRASFFQATPRLFRLPCHSSPPGSAQLVCSAGVGRERRRRSVSHNYSFNIARLIAALHSAQP
jgi:hypothetical protein